MEAAVGCKTVTVSEVSGSSGVGCSEGGGGNGGGLVIAPSSWGLGYNGNGGRTEVAARVEAPVGWDPERQPERQLERQHNHQHDHSFPFSLSCCVHCW